MVGGAPCPLVLRWILRTVLPLFRAINDAVTGHIEKLSTIMGNLAEEAGGKQYRCPQCAQIQGHVLTRDRCGSPQTFRLVRCLKTPKRHTPLCLEEKILPSYRPRRFLASSTMQGRSLSISGNSDQAD